MLELGFLGTGGAVSTAERDNSSFLLNKESDLILIDCPGSPVSKIRKLQSNPVKIKHIMITHVHPDHIYGLPSLLHSLMDVKIRICVFGSDKAIRFCQDLLDLFHLQSKKAGSRVEFFPLEPEATFSLLDGVECTASENPHHPSSLGYRFTFHKAGLNLVYSGDTPIYPPLFRSAENVDFLIHDCSAPSRFFKQFPQLSTMHTHARDLGRYAQEAGIKCLIPIHFFGELDYSVSEIEEEIGESFTGKIIVPKDLQKILLAEEKSKEA